MGIGINPPTVCATPNISKFGDMSPSILVIFPLVLDLQPSQNPWTWGCVSSYYLPISMLSTEDAAMSKIEKVPVLMDLMFPMQGSAN